MSLPVLPAGWHVDARRAKHSRGAAMLFTGSVVFMVCLFIGAYAAAYFVRREWL